MGDIAPSKMPKAKKVVRKDHPDSVDFYKDGGPAKKFPPGSRNKKDRK